MAYLKKIVLQGFKSFARRTEIVLENSMNVIVGPNGSGKSNIADAICFALGRSSSKSIRAEKASNFIFAGNKFYKPCNEASVELIFDNSDNSFPIEKKEISIKRIVRKNGISIYKINEEIKTRQEVLEILAKANIDPDGFNLVLQGEISSFVKMSSLERRKIIEDVAGISIYESRKEKSLRELEKTEEQLKETNMLLREKTNYLKSLEKDRKEALEFKKVEELIKKYKATILFKEIEDLKKEIAKINEEKNKNSENILKIKEQINKTKIEISICQEKINSITKKIEEQTSGEQEILHKEISDLKAEIAGLKVRKENYENRLKQNEIRMKNLLIRLENLEKELEEILKNSPEVKKKREQKEILEKTLTDLEKSRRLFYQIKSEISFLENRKEEKKEELKRVEKEQHFLNATINNIFSELKYIKNIEKGEELKKETLSFIHSKREEIENIEKEILIIERENAVLKKVISEEKKIIGEIEKIDICPLCRSKITEEHKNHVKKNSNEKIISSEETLKNNENKLTEMSKRIKEAKKVLEEKQNALREIENDLTKIRYVEEKKETIKTLLEREKEVNSSIENIEKKLKKLIEEFKNLEGIEEKYEETKLKLKELSLDELDYDSSSIDKQREIERIKSEIVLLKKDNEECEKEIIKIKEKLEEISLTLQKKEEREKEIYEQFNILYHERNALSDKQKSFETQLNGLQHEIRIFEERNYNYKLKEAEIKARIESFESEFVNYKDIEILGVSKELAKSKLIELQKRIEEIGNVNMRAIEVYEQVKNACETIQQKIEVIQKEKEKILEVINEIDKKKKKTFLKTLESINSLFNRNFSQLSKKGEAFLELENKEDPFAGGLEITLKLTRGKHIDVSSLSGGEQTLIALSLIFAIQEYKPYCFYLFDEIDAALDKHNSELLSALIKKYMVAGQYIIITHNDALIENAPVLLGVSMQEGISKIVSQKFN
ncbi:MAG: chromosome segregation SMC family protein [Candidatus Pacearchaeota archaeon]